MDSLLANYAASDDEEEQPEEPPPQPLSSSSSQRSAYRQTSSLLSSLPPPKSSSLESLPPPKHSPKPYLPSAFFDNNSTEVDEEDPQSSAKFGGSSIKSPSPFSSLPRPKGNSANPSNPSFSLPNPRIDDDSDGKLTKSTSLFSSLPQPHSQKLEQPKSNLSSSQPQRKKVVLIKPPVNPFLLKSGEDDDDDDDEDAERRRRKASESSVQTASVASFLSSIPAPKNSATLGALPTAGSGRRSILQTDVPVSASDKAEAANDLGVSQNVVSCSASYDSFVNYSSGVEENVGNHGEYNASAEQNAWNYVNYDGYGNYQSNINQNVAGEVPFDPNVSYSGDYGSYEHYGTYGDYGQYESNPPDPSAVVNAENTIRIPEKRRRNEVPSEIVEVKQDELIKNRPREDQVKLNGIAFGPSYQPASSKGKPSKLHKRKHQINSLYFDMKQKETELAERRARGLLTKSETQAKYGW